MIDFDSVCVTFVNAGNKDKAIEMANYMQNKFVFFGIQSPIRKRIQKPILLVGRKEKEIDWTLIFKCFNDEHRELQYFALDYLKAKQKLLSFDCLPNLYKLAKTKQWWDTIDVLDRLIGDIGLKDNRIDALMLEFSLSDDIWIRRLAIDHQNGRKDKTNKELLSSIILNNLGTKEFFINKAIGWALRDYSKTNQKWVKEFLLEHQEKLSSLSKKEASKYLD